MPNQSVPPPISTTTGTFFDFGPNTNLVLLIEEIRALLKSGNLEKAEKITTEALARINQNEKNRFYLAQIRKEETKLYFALANKAMKEKKFSLASQYLERYRENVSNELSQRKIEREAKMSSQEKRDLSLVGRLVDELDKAKKDLAEIRAKAGLPSDDAKPDLERLMNEEKLKISSSVRICERLLAKAKSESALGKYQQAMEKLDEALSILPSNVSTIALVSDLYQAKQQVIWYQMGESMLKGRVGEVQKLVIEYKSIEDSRRNAETETLGIGEEIDFDSEIRKAQEKNKEQAELAENMLSDAKKKIKQKEYATADELLFKVKNFLEPNTLTWPIILEASLLKNRINLAKAEDARKAKDWEEADQYLKAFTRGFSEDRDIQGDSRVFGRPGLKNTRGMKAVEKELGLADELTERINEDLDDPYERDISEYSPNWKVDQDSIKEFYMRAKVQFINGDLTGAAKTYQNIITRFPDRSLEAKQMLGKIAKMREQQSYLSYVKTRQEMLDEINTEWERPMIFDTQIEETREVQVSTSEIEEKLKLIKLPRVQFFNSPLNDIMLEITRLSRLSDTVTKDATKKGIDITVKPYDPMPTLTLDIAGSEVGKIIDIIVDMSGWSYDIREDRLVMSKEGGKQKGIRLDTEFFEMDQATVDRMTGGSSDAGGANADPFAPAMGNEGPGIDESSQKIKDYFANVGISFDPAKGHGFKFDGFILTVTHERKELDKIQRILERIDSSSSKQIEIEAKFLEVNEGALDELSFDWTYNWGTPTPQFDPTTGLPTISPDGTIAEVYPGGMRGNTRTLAAAHSPTGAARDISITYDQNSDADQVFPNPQPMFPGMVGIGSGTKPILDWKSPSILGGTQARLLVNALKRKQGSDLLAAPRVTVLTGQTAYMRVVQEFIYPIGWTIEQGAGAGGGGAGLGGLGGGGGGGVSLQAPEAEFGAVGPAEVAGIAQNEGFREVGVVLRVEPRIEKFDTIHLDLSPSVTEFDGFVEYGGYNISQTSSFSGIGTVLVPSGQIMPIFSRREVITNVKITNGATVVIGGLTREEVKSVNDKIPILGNLPLVGKLFQSSAESYQKKNLLVFVTANIISTGGAPIQSIQDVGPQSIFQEPEMMTPRGAIRRTFKDSEGEME